MGDEDTDQHKQGSSGRAKIVIRKCKKESSEGVKSSNTSLKKVNGELLCDEKGERNRENNADTIEVKTSKSRPKGSKTITIRSVKRKRPPNTNQTPLVHEVQEDETKITDDKKVDEVDSRDETTSIEFKGFKKRILAQSEKLQDSVSDEIEESTGTSGKIGIQENKITDEEPERPATDFMEESEHTSPKPKIIKLMKGKKKIDDAQGESQAEYAQYLGLQPTMQFKCYRCGEKGFPSLLALNVHQRSCGVMRKSNFIANIQQDQMSPSDPNMLTNFRITRKVYLCSACGTYYENWNLFLHMRDVHKKHICLLCLAMFGVADKLAEHLKVTHNIIESTFVSGDEFQTTYKGSFYLICCVCENMFNERDDFFGHECVRKDPTAKCTICGVKCGHYYTCPNSNSPRTLAGSVPASPTLTVSTTPGTLVKYSGPSSKKKTEKMWPGVKGPGKMSVDNDDDYDVSHAASFCHVDIGDESGDKGKKGTKEDPIDITQDDLPAEATEKINKRTGNEQLEPISSTLDKDIHTSHLEQESEVLDVSSHKGCETVSLKETPDNIRKAEETEEIKIDDVPKSDDSEVQASFTDEGSKIITLITDEINVEKTSVHEIDMDIGNTLKDSSKETEESEGLPILDEKSINTIQPEPGDSTCVINDQKNQDEDLGLSSSDEEPNIHKTASKDGSSSLTKLEDGVKEIVEEQSMNSPKEDSSCETDSDKSGLVVDENPKRQRPARQKSKIIKKKRKESLTNKVETQLDKQHISNEDTLDFHLDIDSDGIQNEGEKENVSNNVCSETQDCEGEINDGIPLAREDVPAMALTLEDKLQDASPQSVVKECVRTSCLNCVYCSHAVKIAVNGKQLALHLLAEHRYKPVKNNETIEDVINKLKKSLDGLDSVFFNTESYDSSDKSLNMPYDHTYECFQCQFMTKSHKELYVHKRKMHQKTVLLCVMCKSTFYSYSELLCHLCPGDNVSEDIYFRCCFCNLDMIPSAFRLMVHLRKGHHTCDICLEVAGDQSKLSTHMWKHKLNHLCYRCGIAYRNKPDITKHLFWKHGTESVVCKKCLQKKWPHVYHFCIPPTVFICEECNASFTRAVALKVHKRLHVGELPYKCSQCDKQFVSKRLLSKHEDAHNQSTMNEGSNNSDVNAHGDSTEEHINVESVDDPDGSKLKESYQNEESKGKDTTSDAPPEKSKKKKKKDKKNKPVVDVYDLPPLNLSSESDSSDDEIKQPPKDATKANEILTDCNDKKQEMFGFKTTNLPLENVEPQEENQIPVPIVDGVWDNFHSYKAELEKRDLKDLTLPNILPSTSSDGVKVQSEYEICKPTFEEVSPDYIMMDHCYCLIPGKPIPSQVDDGPEIAEPITAQETPVKSSDDTLNNNSEEIPAPRGHSSSIDHPYATLNNSGEGTVPAPTNDIAPVPSELPSTQESNPETLADSQSGSQPLSKKKQKTPKKKKENFNSSSSSDSSSDSDSSCCSNCKSNCSCSSNSSSNSSSSSSSDSDSSTPEGRQRAAERKEKKKERMKHKHSKEDNIIKPDNSALPSPGLQVTQREEPVVNIPKAPVETPIRESDLDTDESSTDEDFYDRYPQSHAKQQIEKNKLMLLASVAPVNNGSVSPLQTVSEENNPPTSISKKKIKTKKRKKSLTLKKTSRKGSGPQSQSRPSTSSVTVPAATSTPLLLTSNSQHLVGKTSSPIRTPISNFHSDAAGGSGSENESARLSKRKRVRNKFYGYSSGEEDLERPGAKWRKLDVATASQAVNPVHSYLPPPKSPRPTSTVSHEKMLQKPSESSGTDDESPAKKEEFTNSSSSNSSSSDSDNEIDTKPVVQKEQTEKSDNLYCYCQCPYDEVSEMIACDGQDCTIEWFHFECVGIMVPPKGKWYCPDCRKRRDLM